MRLDKYLWCTRIYKTRSISADAVQKNRVKVNGQDAKPAREIMPGDILTVRKDQIDYRFEILQIPKSRVGAKLVSLYLINKTPAEEIEKLKIRRLSQNYYRQKGEGRPTKKDRRDLDDFISGGEDG